MRTEWLGDVAAWLSSWPEGLWRASWQGALCAGLVWALTRLWTRMPASVRAGLWWLVALKFVVSLVGPHPLALPVLPASLSFLGGASAEPVAALEEVEPSPRVMHGVDVEVAGPVHRGVGVRDVHVDKREVASEGFGSAVPAPVVSSVAPRGEAAAWMRVLASHWKELLLWAVLVAWLGGVAWRVRAQARNWVTMARLRRDARPLNHPDLEEEVRELAASAGLRRVPALLVSDQVTSPLATGLLEPVVVLPTRAVRRLPLAGLRMALAHEVAHLRRGDLWLGWVPALAEALLFFHPLARRAVKEYALAREEACDAEALRLTGAEPADYGELLLAFGVARPHGSAAALGASDHVHALHRRLSMLEHIDIGSSHSRRWLKVTLSVLGLVALVPFQVVARPEGQDASKAPAPAAAPASASSAQTPASASRKQGTTRTGVMPAPTPAAPAAPRSPAPAPGAAAHAVPATPPSPAAPGAPVPSPSPASHAAPPSPAAPGAPVLSVDRAAPPSPAAPEAPSGSTYVSGRLVIASSRTTRTTVTSTTPPAPPTPMMGSAPRPPAPPTPMMAMAGGPTPPKPPRAPEPLDDDSGYVLLSGDSATMNGSMVDLQLAKMFKDKKGGELLYVRRKGETFIIRDEATLKTVREALNDVRAAGEAQGKVGERQGALGREQGALGMKQGALGIKQSELGLRHAELAHKRAGLRFESNRADALPDAERDRRQAELDKQEEELDKQIDALDEQQDALSREQEVLGREQEKLGERQEALGREQAKVSEKAEVLRREAERKVQSLIDEALRKGLGQPLPT
ncbi:peptidase M56 [Myxococcus sp. K38C18041901]|uniref:M56 family metallopeptidase n=1 Tax=Myxococcus guangdongensis TaxID=2906760 RepID=UPI0020A7FEC6|nr:M56 family metallopeptidase [Myxococcus guangdongensis]MCP3059282.1 peptidase M56 [Myxococcus guangdongensis]